MSEKQSGIYTKYVLPCPVLSKRKVITDFPAELSNFYIETFTELQESKKDCAGAPIAIYYDKEFNPAKVDVEVCWPVRTSEQATQTLPEIFAATYIHVGPYTELCAAFNELFQWITENGYVPVGPMREINHNCPMVTPTEKLVTEILVPITKK